jgi:hypothetical protein
VIVEPFEVSPFADAAALLPAVVSSLPTLM